MNIPKLHYVPLPHNHITEIQDFQSSITGKISAQVVDTTDKALYEAIIRYADEQGITDLYIIDEEFVKSAIINEIKRRKQEGER